MDSQSYNFWMPPQSYLPVQQPTIVDLPQELSQVPSLTGSPASSTYDCMPSQLPQGYFPCLAEEPVQYNAYQLPMTPSDMSSDRSSPYCSPQPLSRPEPVRIQHAAAPAPVEKAHLTSGRRRAQNRAAQRAFRERKEKRARDLETQLAAMTEKYHVLESSHGELNAAYDKLRKTVEWLVKDDGEHETQGAGTAHASMAPQTGALPDQPLRTMLLDLLDSDAQVKIEDCS